MKGLTESESISFEIDDVRHVVADRGFKDYTRPYKSTLFGTLHLFVDGEEITHTNKLPAQFDLIDTISAQHELIEIVEAEGAYQAVPFCCVCSDRDCSYIKWTITERDHDYLVIHMADLGGHSIGQTPYGIPRNALYAGFYDFWQEVHEFCRTNDIETFEWADWRDRPITGRDQYATVAELSAWTTDLRELLES